MRLSVPYRTQAYQLSSAHTPPYSHSSWQTGADFTIRNCRMVLVALKNKHLAAPPRSPPLARRVPRVSAYIPKLVSAYPLLSFILHHYRRVAPPCSVLLRYGRASISKRSVAAILSVAFVDQHTRHMVGIRCPVIQGLRHPPPSWLGCRGRCPHKQGLILAHAQCPAQLPLYQRTLSGSLAV